MVKLFYTMVEPGQPLLSVLQGGMRSDVHVPAGFRAGRRPGERCEPVRIRPSRGIDALSDAANELGLDLDLSFTLVLERRLAVRRVRLTFGQMRQQQFLLQLDEEAKQVRIGGAVDAADAAYARCLQNPSSRRCRPAKGEPLTLAVPSRLVQAATAESIEAEDARGLGSARGWEFAAVLSQMHIGEWVAWTALSVIRRAG